MADSLRKQIEEAAGALEGFVGECPLVREEERASLGGRLEEIRRAIVAADRPLRLAILGGTGVGKSTVINALAGSRISAESRRRPTTTDLVVYAHRDWSGESDLPEGEIRKVERHEEESIRDLLIVDFPDFDSLRKESRDVVDRYLPRMDQIIWVVDKEKYNDRRLHDEYVRREAPYRANFLFLFNKIDELADGEGDPVSICVADLVQTLEADGVESPRVFPISARSALQRKQSRAAGPEGEFAAFENHLRSRYTEKYREEIRRGNVIRSLGTLAEQVHRTLDAEEAEARIGEVRARLREARGELHKAGDRLVVGEILSREKRRSLANLLRRGYLEELPGVVGWLAESWVFNMPAIPGLWRGDGGRTPGGVEQALAAYEGQEDGAGARRFFTVLANTARDLEDPLRGVAFARSGAGRIRPDEDRYRGRLRAALGRVVEEIRDGIEEPSFLGKGQFLQHILPWGSALGLGYLTYMLRDYLKPTESLIWHILLAPFCLVVMYLAEAALAHRAVTLAARARADEIRDGFREGLRKIIDDMLVVPAERLFADGEEIFLRWKDVRETVKRLSA